MFFGVETTQDTVGHALAAIKLAVDDARPAFERMVPQVLASVERTFTREGSPAWKPLTPRTQRDRKAQGYGPSHPILTRTGELRSQAFGPSSSHRTAVFSPSELRLEWDASWHKFQHQVGFVSSWGIPVPARPFLVLDDVAERAAVNLLALHVAKAVQASV